MVADIRGQETDRELTVPQKAVPLAPASEARRRNMRTWHQAFGLTHRLVQDPRWRALLPSYSRLLVVAAVEFADADGSFWVRQERWAQELGCSAKTVQRAVDEAAKVGLLEQIRVHHDGWERASTYRFDPLLVHGSVALADTGAST